MKYTIYTTAGEKLFTARISGGASDRQRKGLAVEWGLENNKRFLGADLRDVDLRFFDFNGVDLLGADFSGSSVQCATFKGASVFSTNFSDANIYRASFEEAFDLEEARFENATLGDGVVLKRRLAVARRPSSEYEFVLWKTQDGHIVTAGCRTLTIEEYRKRVAKVYPNCQKGKETTLILNYFQEVLNA